MKRTSILQGSLDLYFKTCQSTTRVARSIMTGTPPAKRVKLDHDSVDPASLRARRAAFLDSFSIPVSPPRGQPANDALPGKKDVSHLKAQTPKAAMFKRPVNGIASTAFTANTPSVDLPKKAQKPTQGPTTESISSPIQLSKIQDLPSSENVDTLSLHDILGDPLIKEAWIFNFCFDVDWLMNHFDPDVRDLVDVKIVHGSWRREDANKIAIDEACKQRSNVKAVQAYLHDAFGTHHSKMFILFRHDDSAQIVIHTANMLSKDWSNMTQAMWRSPPLPLSDNSTDKQEDASSIGNLFKSDVLRYLNAYGSKLKGLVKQLQTHSFDEVKAVLVASVPSKFKVSAPDDEVWGHEMLRRKLLNALPRSRIHQASRHVVFQVSSIATLPSGWLEGTLGAACGSSKESTSIVFPTAADVAMSLDGYLSGGSIHTKAQSATHLKQIASLRPQLNRWASGKLLASRAGRDLAAPHIKTYIRFASEPTRDNPVPDIDWALVTSANLSTQAWGSAPKLAKGERNQREAVVHIQSYEIGVLIWPELFADTVEHGISGRKTEVSMIPCFRKDTPDARSSATGRVVGFRMPYDLPLTKYFENELPWSPQSTYEEPDRHGRLWQ